MKTLQCVNQKLFLVKNTFDTVVEPEALDVCDSSMARLVFTGTTSPGKQNNKSCSKVGRGGEGGQVGRTGGSANQGVGEIQLGRSNLKGERAWEGKGS